MDLPFETLKHLPSQLCSWAQSHWARWIGSGDVDVEAVYWALKDALGSSVIQQSTLFVI